LVDIQRHHVSSSRVRLFYLLSWGFVFFLIHFSLLSLVRSWGVLVQKHGPQRDQRRLSHSKQLCRVTGASFPGSWHSVLKCTSPDRIMWSTAWRQSHN
jgi:hypothetical protein